MSTLDESTRPAASAAAAMRDGGTRALSLRALGVTVALRCAHPGVRALVQARYVALRERPRPPALAYAVEAAGGAWRLVREGAPAMAAESAAEVVDLLDEDLVIQLQRRRPDLYHVHGAALEAGGRAFLLVGPSGSGKSTATWALLHHGYRYLSDELAPVDLDTLAVYPYPRAVSLKRQPPAAYPLPGAAVPCEGTFSVPASAAGAAIRRTPAPLAAVFFVDHAPRHPGPALSSVAPARAAARLYASALNALAHPGDGLDGAVAIARRVPAFELVTADLARACALVGTVLASPSRRRPAGAARRGA